MFLFPFFSVYPSSSSCLCTTVTACGPNQFLCHDQLKCIDKSQECDLSVDCYDGSDEHSNCRKKDIVK